MCRHVGDFRLWVLALTPECEKNLLRIRPAGIEVVPLTELEAADPEFMKSRKTRSLVEYYFTSTPCLLDYLLKKHSEIDRITYLDADMFFFSDPSPVEQEVEASSIAITPHRFRPELASHRKYGIYNVGWLSFRADRDGQKCLAEWRRQCLEWCRDEPEGGRFGDQGYLDAWPQKYPGTLVLDQPGFNEAPWNVEVKKIKKKRGKFFIGKHPLVLFHFQSLRRISTQIFNPNWHDYGLRPNKNLIQWVYQPYLSTLIRTEARCGLSAKTHEFIRGQKNNAGLSLRGNLLGCARAAIKILNGDYLLARACTSVC